MTETSRPFRPARRALLVGLCLTLLPGLLPGSPAAAADRTVEELLIQGEGALDRRDPRSAIRSFERADEQAEGGSVEARLGLARAFLALGAHKKAIESAEDALEIAAEPEAQVAAHTYMGVAYSEKALDSRRADDELAASERAFQAALAVPDVEKPPTIYLNLGIVLMRQERDEDGIAMLERFLETDPSQGDAMRARSLIDDPRRSRESIMPQLALVTLDGGSLTDEDLEGKVVVLDFWTTWCAPCHQALPTLRDLHEMSEKGDPLMVISVSGDSSEALVRDYVRDYSIGWTQVWDARERLAHSAFQVGGYPTFVVVGHDGEIVFRDSGWSEPLGQGLRRAIRDAIKKARREARQDG
jgi:thiol-disulfide isomerase/thioredoxin